jgi:hypothetical protein
MRNGRQIMPAPGERGARQVPLGDWIHDAPSELVTRRHQVFGLLGWYHRTQVLPWRGVRGWLRRYWLILTGRRMQTLSPWEVLELRAAAGAMAREAQERAEAEAEAQPE